MHINSSFGIIQSAVSCILLASLILLSSSVFADTNSDYAKSVNDTAVSGVKNGNPWTVPNYAEPHPDYENLMYDGDQLKIEGKNASTTNEAAQVIYNLPHATINQSDGWYQNASNTTSNPSAALPATTESSCSTTTVPGDTVTTTQSCITSETATNESCKTPVQVTVDADYDYECHKNRQSTGQNCQVGHLIDVTKSYNYKCTKTQVFQDASCEQYYAINPGNLTCESSWSLSGTQCTKTAQTILRCSNGYTKIYWSPLTACCPNGYTNSFAINGSRIQCIASNGGWNYSEPLSQVATCPSGSTLSGSTCIKTATGTPPSTYLVDNCTAYE